MGARMATVHCGGCKRPLDEVASVPAGPRVPCLHCGVTSRHFAEHVSDTVTVYDSMRLKGKEPGRGGHFITLATGASFYHDEQKWMERTMRVDGRGNLYDETVIDLETGKATRECHEPLDQHTGHGSARRRLP
jgi:hypothetical protein